MDELDWRRVRAVLLHGGPGGMRRIAREILGRSAEGDLAVLWATVRSDEPRLVRLGCLRLLTLIADEGGSPAADWIMGALDAADAGAESSPQPEGSLVAQPGYVGV